jgi:hypothetical protein
LVPLQPLLAVQDVLLVAVHVSIAEEPGPMLAGEAPIVTAGGLGGAMTVTVVLCVAGPLGPVQASVYVVVAVGATDCVPLEGLVPVQPLLAVQDVMLVEVHVSKDEEPATMLAGDGPMVTVGGLGGALTVTAAFFVTDPFDPEQTSVYVVVAVGVTDAVPLVDLTPVQPLLAVQDVLPVALHVRVAEAPEVIDAGETVRLRVGAGGVPPSV